MIKTTHNILPCIILLCASGLAAQGQSLNSIAQDSSCGQEISVFVSKIPTLQKVGQIIAQVEGIPPDIQQSPQTLETGVSTKTRDEFVSHTEKDVGAEPLRKYDLPFDDHMLAEASAGAAIDDSFQLSGEPKRQSFSKPPAGSRFKRFALAFAVKFIAVSVNRRPD